MGKLIHLRFRPGINREVTSHTNEGGWRDCDKIRFRWGFPETIGGWVKYSDSTFLGVCRALFPWETLSFVTHVAIGTNYKYYVEKGGLIYDITPIRETTSAGDVTFSATNGESDITVSDTNHGAIAGDFVTYSGAASLGGNVTAAVLNQEYQIDTITDGNTYVITAKDTDSVTVTANASDTGNGGASVVGEYQINTSIDTTVYGAGWGSDPWSDGAWGAAGSIVAGEARLGFWSQDNFGEDLIFNRTNMPIFYWDASVGTGTRAVNLTTISGASDVPTVSNIVMVSDSDRHVIAFGCDPLDDVGTQDPLLIRWSDQENAADWTPTTTNTAGDLRLGSGTQIIAVTETKREIVIFTDVSMHSMQFLGPPYTFGIQLISSNIQIFGQKSVVNIGDAVFAMANGKFYKYDGNLTELQCSVEDYVFSDFNNEQRQKAYGGHNLKFSEIWWFYPSSGSEENDRYVVYNYEQDIWYYGSMARTAWVVSGLLSYPVAASPDGYLYSHENGLNDGSTNPESAISPFIESADFEIEDGDRFFFANRVIPDVTFRSSVGVSPLATMTLKARDYPGLGFDETDDGAVTRSASSPVELYTKKLDIRLRGRSVVLKVESSDTNTAWRVGTPKLEIRTDGKK
jgi:hypothetical protein